MKDLKIFSQEFEKNIKKLTQANVNFKNHITAMEEVLAKIKRNSKYKPEKEEKDFSCFAENTSKIITDLISQIQDLRCVIRTPNKQLSSLILKDIVAFCKTFKDQINTFNLTYRQMQSLIADASLSLKWWLIQGAYEDLHNLEVQVALIIREIQKKYV